MGDSRKVGRLRRVIERDAPTCWICHRPRRPEVPRQAPREQRSTMFSRGPTRGELLGRLI